MKQNASEFTLTGKKKSYIQGRIRLWSSSIPL